MRRIYGVLVNVALNFRWYMAGAVAGVIALVWLTRFAGAEWSLHQTVESHAQRIELLERRQMEQEANALPVEMLRRLIVLLEAAAADRPTPNTGSPQPQRRGPQE